jgi:hypothetical protein
MKRRRQLVTYILNTHSNTDLGIGGRNAGQPPVCSLHHVSFAGNKRRRSRRRSELSRPYRKLYQHHFYDIFYILLRAPPMKDIRDNCIIGSCGIP